MTRIEIIANKSVQEDIVSSLESAVEDFMYTLIPVVHGKGRSSKRMGTSTWPEENFLLISYLDDDDARAAAAAVAAIKKDYAREGIKVFLI